MDVGVAFPTTEIGADLAAVRDYIQATEELGYSHLRILDHVLGADPQWHPEVPVLYYTHRSVIHEPFTLMAYVAALTSRVHLVTGILILPQRQTALVAKQAAELDVLSNGRLRLGVGVGWNPVEYEALGQDFHTRGKRCEEQISVLRALWTQEVVNFHGRWHQISHAGLNPPPIQRPIPIWIGAGSPAHPIPPEAALRRIARLADGWFPLFGLGDAEGREAIARLHGYVKEAGRDPKALGLEGRITLPGKEPEHWATEIKAWQDLGATHLAVVTGGGGLRSPREHIEVLRRFKAVVDS
jgi:probable F420-dependent oxidoreductase